MSDAAALSGLRVLDLGLRASTAWCGRLLADYGAEVIGVEAAPHPLRSEGPFSSEGTSIPSEYFLASRGIADDATQALMAAADVIICSDPASAASAQANPRAIVCAITPYGLTGRLAERSGNDLTAAASSGWAAVNGMQDRPPLKGSGYQSSFQAGTFAFGTLVTALIEWCAQGESRARLGQLIDISEREVLVSTGAPAPLRIQYSGFEWSRRTAVDVNEGPVPVADGWFALTISRPMFWIKAMELLGLPDLAEDTELQQAGLRHKLKDRFVDRVGEAMSRWKRMDLFNALGERRVIAGPVLTMDELAENPQFEARGFYRERADGTRFPGPFARMQRTPFRTPTPCAPQDTFASDDEIDVNVVRKPTEGRGPLAGFRGLVLTQAWAGTYATQLLGLLGADVIQLETRGRLDSWRGSYQNPIPKKLQDNPAAEHAWNCSPLYNSVNLNKRCITVDLAEPEGVALFKELVQHADFVAENFSPRVMGNLGIDYEALTAINPRLVMASLSAYGAVGPWAKVPGIGGTIEPSSGMSALLGYEGAHPMNSGQMYPDPVAGLCGFSAIALALLHRDRTGEGQYIDLSMQEANFTFIGDAWLEFAINGDVRGPRGNSHPSIAPHGIYRCAGEDEWVAISARTDDEWKGLVAALELQLPAEWTAPERKANEAEVDAAIAAWSATLAKQDAADRVSAAGACAAAVLRPGEIPEDADLRERGHMVVVAHPEAGEHWQSGLAAKLSRTPGGVTRHAPLQGQHSFEVFAELVGMSQADYDALVDRELTGKGATSKSSVANQA